MIVNARLLSTQKYPSNPPNTYVFVVTVKDELNALNTMLTSAGELMVDGTIIMESGQQIETESFELIVTYTLKKTINSARLITVNGTTLGTVKSLADSVEITIPKTREISIGFLKAT